ncbi:uncharacterized protein PAC_08564 [Phialocephala subalpina]|uniref:Uncharacterized protein n=1 Tax=Phialocephala subalpina TaxID=576137 RepID=A0A1L7X0Y5_9HELO|nr:uncharacterized protein PAC_08564 [Phialocephala subalpina]
MVRAVPFNSAMALTTLFSITSAIPSSSLQSLKTRMEMPDSPPPPPPPPGPPPSTSAKVWNFATNGLPVSYRVAIIIDAFVLVVTIISLCLLGWYMRKQYRRRRLLQAIREQEQDDVGLKLRDLETEMEEGNVGGGSVDLDSSFEPPSSSPNPQPSTPTLLHGSKQKSGKHEALRKFDLDYNEEEGYGDSSKLGYRVNPLGKAKSSPISAEFRGDPLGKAGGLRLWEEEKERHRRVGQRVAAGYDGFRGN